MFRFVGPADAACVGIAVRVAWRVAARRSENAVKGCCCFMNGAWDIPHPRSGWRGTLDRFVGPGATKSELALQFAFSALAAVAALIYAAYAARHWSWLQYLICGVLTLDIAGGIITNSTSSAKRWYHRAGQGAKRHFGFVSVHLFHLLLVSCLYLGFDIFWVAVAGGYLLLATALILSVPQYLQRPVGMAAYSGALLITIYVLAQPEGLEWFLPLFYLKLLVSHLLKEEPYRPQAEMRS